MNIEVIHSKHPLDDAQEIALVYIDGSLDEPSSKWLANAARCGGRKGKPASGGTLVNMATEIARLYEDLEDMGKVWYKATESDLEHLRDTYLHWLPDVKEYNFKKISNNAMRIKLWYWFNFFTFQKQSREAFAFTPTFNHNAASQRWKNNTSYLSHLNKRANSEKDKKVTAKDWTLMIDPDPKKTTYHALTKSEFLHFRKHLRKIDIVYELIAVFLVETGLRITAALEIADSTFEGYFVHLHSKESLDESIPVPFINKGNRFRNTKTEFKLPLRCIRAIQDNYRADGSMYRKRKRLNSQLVKKGYTDKLKSNTFWFKKNGYAVLDQDVQKAFRDASKAMGRKGRESISPHWMRHTFATWIIMDHIKKTFGGEMNNTNIVPEQEIILLLSKHMHHVSIETTRIYIATAMDLLGLGRHSGAAPMTQRAFLKDKDAQKIVEEEAEAEFGHKFEVSKFDLLRYAIARGKVVDDD